MACGAAPSSAALIEDSRVIMATYDGLYRLLTQQDSSGATYALRRGEHPASAIEPGGTLMATCDVANQLLMLNGLPVQYDANGKLLNNGEAKDCRLLLNAKHPAI